MLSYIIPQIQLFEQGEQLSRNQIKTEIKKVLSSLSTKVSKIESDGTEILILQGKYVGQKDPKKGTL